MPAATPALRQTNTAVCMAGDSYSRNFGYPTSTGRGLISPDELEKAAAQKKDAGWTYRPAGEGKPFDGDGKQLYAMQAAKAALAQDYAPLSDMRDRKSVV